MFKPTYFFIKLIPPNFARESSSQFIEVLAVHRRIFLKVSFKTGFFSHAGLNLHFSPFFFSLKVKIGPPYSFHLFFRVIFSTREQFVILGEKGVTFYWQRNFFIWLTIRVISVHSIWKYLGIGWWDWKHWLGHWALKNNYT